MGLLEFNKLPINTLVGADWKTFKAITAGREIDAAYKGKYRLTKAVCRLLSPLAGMKNGWLTNRWNMTRYLSWGIGGAERLSCITYSRATSILGIIQRTRLYSLI